MFTKKIKIELKETLILAIPLVATLLAQMGMEFISTWMMGWLGASALAVGSFSISIYVILLVPCIGFANAAGVIMARAYGANDNEKLALALQQGIWLTTICSIPGLIILWYLPYALANFGFDSTLIAHSTTFLHLFMWSFLPVLWYLTLREFMAVVRLSRVVMWIILWTIPLDAALNYILMYGKLGLPAMGIAGIAIANVLANLIAVVAVMAVIIMNKSLRRYNLTLTNLRYDKAIFIEIFKLGWPLGLTILFEVGLFATSNLLMGKFGTIPLAAHQIAIQCAQIAFMIPLGISQATAVRVGMAMGANNLKDARLSGIIGLFLGIFLGILTASAFIIFREHISQFYLHADSKEHLAVLALANHFIVIAAIFQLFDVIQVIMGGALRGLKDAVMPMLLGLISYWVIGLVCGVFLAFYSNWQGIGLWWGLAIGIIVSGILLLLRFHLRTRADGTNQGSCNIERNC